MSIFQSFRLIKYLKLNQNYLLKLVHDFPKNYYLLLILNQLDYLRNRSIFDMNLCRSKMKDV